MNNFGKLWNKSILRRLIISFICILIPIYILSIIIYNTGKGTLREEISNSMISQVSSYMGGLEKDVKRIRTLQFDFVVDNDLNKLASIPEAMNDIEKLDSILRIQRRATAIKNSSIYIKDVSVFIPKADRTIFSSYVSTFDQNEFDKLKQIPASPDAQVININGRMMLSCIYPATRVNSSKQPLFIIAVELSEAKIEEALHAMVTNKGEGVILINPITQSVISTNHDSSFNDRIQRLIYDNMNVSSTKTHSIGINNEKYMIVYSSSSFFGSILCKYIPENSVFKPLQKYQIWFALLTVTALIIIIIYSLYLHRFIHRPLSRLIKSFKQVESGNFSVAIEHNHDDEFRYIYQRFNAMVDNLKGLIDQAYKQKILTQKAELKQLQSQINPHFLYNSFFILNTMSRIGDYDNLERFTEQLGEYFQFVTRSAADEVTLSKEVNHARVYSEIQAMRFSNRIKVQFDELPEMYASAMVPRLILQPIIENAFEHGLERKIENGLLVVKFSKVEDDLNIIIEDNGSEMQEEELEKLKNTLSSKDDNIEVTGILNIHRRIQLKFGTQNGLQVMQGESGGLKVVITIKFMEGDQNV